MASSKLQIILSRPISTYPARTTPKIKTRVTTKLSLIKTSSRSWIIAPSSLLDYNIDMEGYTLEELQTILGLRSIPAVRQRVNLIRNVLEERMWLRRGANNEILITHDGLEILRHMEDLRRKGLTLRQAAQRVLDELGYGQERPPANDVKELKARLERLESKLAELEGLCAALERSWLGRVLFRLPRLPSKTGSNKLP